MDKPFRGLLPVLFMTATLATRALPADDLQVMPEKVDGMAPAAMLEAHLLEQAHAALERRLGEYEALRTPDDLARWKQRCRRLFLQRLGELPPQTPLNARVTARQAGDGYTLEKVLFESQPGFHVTALLYLPAAPPPFPAVLHACGHSENAKAYESYQRASILMAKNGIAVLCFDPVGQGERKQVLDDQGKPRFQPTAEHAVESPANVLLGRNLARTMAWDGMRAIDYLQSRPEIDPGRIGCMGNSGGGTQTSYLMALEGRISAAAPNCYLTTFGRLLDTIGPQDPEQNLFGQVAAGLDQPDYVLMRAPRPTLFGTVTRDFFDIAGSWDNFRQAKRFYTRLGYPERVDLVESDATHGFNRELREATVRFMRRWLLGKDDPVTEGQFPVLTDAEAQVTPRGQVLLMEGERSIFDLNRDEETRLAKERERFWMSKPKEQALAEVRRLAGIRPLGEIPPVEARRVGETAREGYRIEKLTLQVEPGITLPALWFVPARAAGEAVLYLHEGGKATDAAPGGPIEALVRAGRPVLAADLRGIGELQARNNRGEPAGTSGKDVSLAYLLGRSMLGMRAEDTLACARYFSTTNGGRPLALVAIGEVAPPALHAAALEPGLFSSVELKRCLAAWSDVVRTPVTRNQAVNLVHGALTRYDLPDLKAAIPTGRLTLADPVDAVGNPLSLGGK